MAWGGRSGRLSGRFVKGMFRKWRQPPLREDPNGIPRAVMKGLAWETLPLDKETYQRKLQELLQAYQQNGEQK
jgi:hypothetical protein